MMGFDMKIKFDGKVVQKAKVEDIEDLEPFIDGLKEKFGSDHKKRRR